jgi:hypothetical protein
MIILAEMHYQLFVKRNMILTFSKQLIFFGGIQQISNSLQKLFIIDVADFSHKQ